MGSSHKYNNYTIFSKVQQGDRGAVERLSRRHLFAGESFFPLFEFGAKLGIASRTVGVGDVLGSDVALTGVLPSFGTSYFLAAAALCGHCFLPPHYVSANPRKTLAEKGRKNADTFKQKGTENARKKTMKPRDTRGTRGMNQQGLSAAFFSLGTTRSKRRKIN